jgi:hypothetical protein
MATAPSIAREWTLDERVRAQEAMERVAWSHRIWPKDNPGAKPPFGEALPAAAIRSSVGDSLRKSRALDTIWSRPITHAQLQAEMDRIVANTRDPKVLRELFAALGDDPDLIAEAMARPLLADRLIRSWYANDERLHATARRQAELALTL